MDYRTEDLLNGIQLILKYQPEAEYYCAFEEFWFGTTTIPMTPEDEQQMYDWGWGKQTEVKSWSR